MKKIKVSVIVPIYNTEKFLEKCIESILNQTLEEIEIILINDGSTDNCHKICQEYAEKNKDKIRYINNKNIGCSATRNLGIELARGEYIAFVDSDDYIDKEMYEEMYNKALEENSDVVVCGINSVYLISNESKISLPKFIRDKYSNLSYKKKISNPVNKIFRKELIIKNKIRYLINTHSFEDFNFCFKIIVSTDKVTYIYKSFYNYIYHENNSIYNLKKRTGIFISFNELYDYLFKNNYLKNKKIELRFYECFNFYAIRGVFFMLLNPELVSELEYKKYNQIFYNELKKIGYLTLRSKFLIFYYRNLVFFIRKFNLYFILKKIKNRMRG